MPNRYKSVRTALWAAAGITSVTTAALFLIPGKAESFSYTLRPQTSHLVTADLKSASNGRAPRSVPHLSVTTLQGESRPFEDYWKDKPLLVFFVERACPCCLAAKPALERLLAAYEGELTGVCVINAEPSTGAKWKQMSGGAMDVVCDPHLTVVKAFGVERGVTIALIDNDGAVVRTDLGYSRSMLLELGKTVAKICGVDPRPFETRPAPERLSSGCPF